MSAIDFPGSPGSLTPPNYWTAGSGVQYKWDGEKWVSTGGSDTYISMGGTGTNFVTGHIKFADTKKAIFGADQDLQIFEDDSDSYIIFNNGDLRIKSGSTESLKVTSAGIEVIGSLTISGNVDGVDVSTIPSVYAPLATPALTGTPTAPTPSSGDDSTKIATTAFVATSFAPLNSAALIGAPTSTTPSSGDNSTKIATTAFVATSFAPLNSPALIGVPTSTTPSSGDDSTKIATTAFVKTSFAPLNSPALTGTPTAQTPSSGDSSTKIATTAFVATSFAPLNSAALTGIPTAPTAASSNNTQQLATTAFVQTKIAPLAPLATPALTGTPTAPTPSSGDNSTKLATTAFVATSFAPLNTPALTGTPTSTTPSPGDNSTRIATTAFVNTAVLGEDWWNRSGTTLSPSNASDKADIPIVYSGNAQSSFGGPATFTKGSASGSIMGYYDYELLYDFGSAAANTDKRIISVAAQDIGWSSIGFTIDIIDNNANYASIGSIDTVYRETYYVNCVRSNSSTTNDPDAIYVRGPDNLIRGIKVSQGNYEVVIRNDSQWREYRISIKVHAVHGNHTVTYHNGDTPSSGTAVAPTKSTTSYNKFQGVDFINAISTGPIAWYGTLSTFAPSGTGSDTATDVAIALQSGHRIVASIDGYIRTLLEFNNGSDIEIGATGTSIIQGINLKPGTSGLVKIRGTTVPCYRGQIDGDWNTIFTTGADKLNTFGTYQINNMTGGTHSNYPAGAYGWGGLLAWQLANHTFKLYSPHHGDLYYQAGWNNDEYTGWRKIRDSGNDDTLAKYNAYAAYTTVLEDSGFISYYAITSGKPATGNYWSGIQSVLKDDKKYGWQIVGQSGNNLAEDLYVRKINNNSYGSWSRIWTATSLTNVSQLTNNSGYLTLAGTINAANWVTGSELSTTNAPDSVLEYHQKASVTDTKIAPTTDWYNTIRMGHGDPYTYYSNTIAVKMTGGSEGQMYTQCIKNNVAQGWRTHWDSVNKPDPILGSVAGSGHIATGRVRFTACQTNNWDTIATTSGSQGGIEIYNTAAGNDAFMSFHSGGDFALYFGLNADNNDLAVGGWSMGANKYRIWHAGNTSNIATAKITTSNGQELVLNAGEAGNYFTGQGGEYVYHNAEHGILISTPDRAHSNFQTDWVGKYTYINGQYIQVDSTIMIWKGNGYIYSNTAVGTDTLEDNTSGNHSTAFGYQALKDQTTPQGNTAFGSRSGYSINTGGHNTSMGMYSLMYNTTGHSNTALGRYSMHKCTTGVQNTAVGRDSNYNLTTGSNNTSIGMYAGLTMVGATGNTNVGFKAGYVISSGNYNVSIGVSSHNGLTTGSNNAVVGTNAGYSITTGNNNVAMGRDSLFNVSTGHANIGFGFKNSSGAYVPVFNPTTHSNRVVMGHTGITNAYVKVAWTVTSDERDKMNFSEVPHGLDFINKLQPIAFQFKIDRDTEKADGPVRYGFKAQDILAIEGDNPVIIDNEDPDHLKYQGESLIPVLVKAIQLLSREVKALSGKVNEIDSRLDSGS